MFFKENRKAYKLEKDYSLNLIFNDHVCIIDYVEENDMVKIEFSLNKKEERDIDILVDCQISNIIKTFNNEICFISENFKNTNLKFFLKKKEKRTMRNLYFLIGMIYD